MSKRLLACVLGVLALLFATPALADDAPPVAAQVADQSSTSEQGALAASEATQVKPSNTNIDIRVLSPGDNGDVEQSNEVSSEAEAENENETKQDVDQSQGGAGGIQTADQSNSNGQLAAALSSASQYGASNVNLPIRVGSEGDNGSVEQSNEVESEAEAENDNETKQTVDQSQAGATCCPTDGHEPTAAPAPYKEEEESKKEEPKKDDCCPSSTGIQTADQSNSNEQAAVAASEATQKGAKNVNLDIRVLSKGDNGDVEQTNSVESEAEAENENETKQSVDQSQGGSGHGGCCPAGQAVQTADQDNESGQAAIAKSTATQEKPKNVNISIRVLSPGDNGDVEQSNKVSSKAEAENDNETKQDVDQSIGSGKSKDSKDCCPSSTGIQTAEQSNFNGQLALAKSEATQKDATNVNLPIRVGSEGDNGSVEQSNEVSSEAEAENDNETKQFVDQTQAGGHGCCPKDGHDGKDAYGKDSKKEDCCPSSTGIQTAEQSNASLQAAAAFSEATQKDAKNVNAPIRVKSDGDNGSVEQSNEVESEAEAENDNETKQDVDQTIGSRHKGSDGKDGMDAKLNGEDGKKDDCCPSSTGIQIAKQSNFNGQLAIAKSEATQKDAKNVNAPIRVKSEGDNGDVEQSNEVESEAEAENDNDTKQSIDQTIGGGSKGHDDWKDHGKKDDCGCKDSTAVQTAKQSNANLQAAAAFSEATQKDAKNVNAPIRVKSDGDNGDVEQSNEVSSEAEAENDNETKQSIDQTIGSGHKGSDGKDDWKKEDGKDGKDDGKKDDCCHGGTGIQIADQSNFNGQLAIAKSEATQKDAKNVNAPIRVKSEGDNGDVEQSNEVESEAEAENDNETKQDVDQTIGGGSKGHDDGKDGKDGKKDECCHGGTAIQVADQSNASLQAAAAFSEATQKDAKNVNAPIRVKSDGDDGDVEQSNEVESEAEAENDNETKQTVDQSQGSGGSGIGVQVAGQENFNGQLAAAASAAFQKGASNKNAPLRVKSEGDGGSVEQSNEVSSEAEAENENETKQDVDQTQRGGHDCKCSDGIGIQVAAQKNVNLQAALSKSIAVQDFGKSDCGCPSGGNSNSPTRVFSSGDDGDVEQSNEVSSEAEAENENETKQDVDQTQFGGSGIGVQVAGQESFSGQLAVGLSAAAQFGASNSNSPTRVFSDGDGGSVEQSNEVESEAEAENENETKQDVDQFQGSKKKCGCPDDIGIQVAGQSAKNKQIALALSAAIQLAPKNSNKPVSVKSHGDGGSVEQENEAESEADSENDNQLKQLARQLQL